MSTEVVMPQMGESIAEGTITKWLKKVGERVERDEPLFEISTDKVDAEIPSPAAGTLTEIRFREGDTVEINTTVAVLDGGDGAAAAPAAAETQKAATPEVKAEEPPPAVQAEAAAATEAEAPTPAPAPKPEVAPPPAPAATRSAPAAATSGNGRKAETAEDLRRTKSSPLVRRIAQEHGVDIASLEGTGMS